jgi:hypothetical protein
MAVATDGMLQRTLDHLNVELKRLVRFADLWIDKRTVADYLTNFTLLAVLLTV